MAQPFDDHAHVAAIVTSAATTSVGSAWRERIALDKLAQFALPFLLLAASGPAAAQPAPTTTAPQEQRRIEERDRALREQLERQPDVRTPIPAEAAPSLPVGETPCFAIKEFKLQVSDADPRLASRFAFALESAAGIGGTDSPLGRCLGAQGVAVLIKRVQNALIARGYVTTRVLAEPQDLKTGVLTLTVIPVGYGMCAFLSKATGAAIAGLHCRPNQATCSICAI